MEHSHRCVLQSYPLPNERLPSVHKFNLNIGLDFESQDIIGPTHCAPVIQILSRKHVLKQHYILRLLLIYYYAVVLAFKLLTGRFSCVLNDISYVVFLFVITSVKSLELKSLTLSRQG